MMRPQKSSDGGLGCTANIQYMPTLKPITAATVAGFLMSDNKTSTLPKMVERCLSKQHLLTY